MKSLQRSLALLAAIALFGAGCGSTPAPAEPGSPAAPTAAVPTRGSGDCNNAYYPFKVGRVYTYKSHSGSGTATTESTYTMKVLPTEGANTHKLEFGFTVRGQAFPLTQEFTCEDGTITARGQLDMASALGGMQFSFETESVDGEFMPASLSVGKSWDTVYKVILHTNNSMLKAVLDGKRQTTTVKNSVIGEESVTVAAGTYRALKVKQETTIDSEAVKTGPITFTTTSWFVKDIGMVKSETVSATGSSSIEAQSISG